MSAQTAKTAVNPGGVMKTATKTTAKPKMTAKQYAQYLRYVRTHKTKKSTKAKKAKKAAGPCTGGWVTGGNDVLETCAMTAVANSLLFATGLRASDEEIAAFGEGLTIEEALELARGGLAGVRLRDAFPVGAVFPGAVLGLELDGGSHAALSARRGLMVSWGGLVPARGVVEEAWALDWALLPDLSGCQLPGARQDRSAPADQACAMSSLSLTLDWELAC
jgi:hypothetical protein